jgi:integrase
MAPDRCTSQRVSGWPRYKGNILTRSALQLTPILFQRPGQLRFAHWEDIDFDQALWSCPPEKMKMREWQKRDSRTQPHLVPLPRQAVAILQDLYRIPRPLAGRGA